MRNSEIYAIPTVGNLTEINSITENPELCGNLTKILTEFLLLTELPEITRKLGIRF